MPVERIVEMPTERSLKRPTARPVARATARATARPLYLTDEMLAGLECMHRYRFLTIGQFARVTSLSLSHAREVLRRLHYRRLLGYIGYFVIPGGRAPKVYFLARRGVALLASLRGGEPSDLGPFRDLKRDPVWIPQMFHRLALVDALVSLECAVRSLPHLHLVQTFLEYRRVPGTHARETADYVCEPNVSENRLVPDGAFVLENRETGRRGLFLLEMDMGSEQVRLPRVAQDARATIVAKFVRYDTYLAGGRFAQTYKAYGDFHFATVLLVTNAASRVENIRRASERLSPTLHRYYRLTTQERAVQDFLGSIWKSRDPKDPSAYALIARPSGER